jgi:hypothetical protein
LTTGAGAAATGVVLEGVVQPPQGDCILLAGGVDGGVAKVGNEGAPLAASVGGCAPLASGGGIGSGGA